LAIESRRSRLFGRRGCRDCNDGRKPGNALLFGCQCCRREQRGAGHNFAGGLSDIGVEQCLRSGCGRKRRAGAQRQFYWNQREPPSGAGNTLNAANINGFDVFNPNYRTPRSWQMNIGIQHEIRPGMIFSAGFHPEHRRTLSHCPRHEPRWFGAIV